MNQSTKPKRGGNRRFAALLLLLLLLLVILLGIWWWLHQNRQKTTGANGVRPDSTATIDTTRQSIIIDSIADTSYQSMRSDTTADTSRTDSVQHAAKPRHPRRIRPVPDSSVQTDTANDSTAMVAVDRCAGDTIAPWVYPDPSGGLHRTTITVRFAATKSCSISWRMSVDSAWQAYTGQPIDISRTASIQFKAIDSCGNSMTPRTETYEIRPLPGPNVCPADMEYIEVQTNRFCIDVYEWPNRKGVRPSSYVSIYQAQDSCFTLGKRLCTQDEWSLACGGPYGWRYPYGAAYEPHACNTRDTTMYLAGSKPECRGYFNVFDMAGNMAEWTDTRSQRNVNFYNVMGGFWESGPAGDCFSVRYSYFPQNRHNPVGFRCCKQINN
jgi:hypothetical protein